MPTPWTLGAVGLTILALLYYICWRYAARWVCRVLLQRKVVFAASTKAHEAHRAQQNGIVKEMGEKSDNHEVGSLNHKMSDSGTEQREVCTPYVVTDGVLAEISQL